MLIGNTGCSHSPPRAASPFHHLWSGWLRDLGGVSENQSWGKRHSLQPCPMRFQEAVIAQ